MTRADSYRLNCVKTIELYELNKNDVTQCCGLFLLSFMSCVICLFNCRENTATKIATITNVYSVISSALAYIHDLAYQNSNNIEDRHRADQEMINGLKQLKNLSILQKLIKQIT